MNLQRTIGTPGLLFTAIAGIMGSGWLFGPYYAARMAGPASILAWVIGGCLMMIVAITFAELASTFPIAGGSVRFLQLSHGPFVSFTMAWIGWLASVAVAPIETLALLRYADNYVPFLMHRVNGVHMLTTTGFFFAAGLMLIMCILNVYGAKLLSKTNAFMAFFKLGIPIITAVVLLAIDFHPHNLSVGHFAPMGIKAVLMSLPAAGVIFSFIGYSPAINLAGEAKNPQRAIPIAIFGSLGICIIIYIILQLAFIGALPAGDIAHGWAHLAFHHDAGPFAGIATAIGALWLAYLIYAGALIAPFGTAFIYTAATARLGYAMRENGYLPRPLHKLNRFGIPARIIALNYVVGLLLFLPFPTWQKMVSFLVSALVLLYAVGPLSLLVLRKTMPNQKRPFRVPMARVVCLVAFYICNLIVFWTGWSIISKMLIAIVLGYFVLGLYKLTPLGKELDMCWRKGFWVLLYVAAMGVVSYLGSFGGGINLVPFGWDFLVIAIVSWCVFELALFCGLRNFIHQGDGVLES